MAHEIVLGYPGEALLVDVQVREGRGGGSLSQEAADGFAFVQPEGRDVDHGGHVRREPPSSARSNDDSEADHAPQEDRVDMQEVASQDAAGLGRQELPQVGTSGAAPAREVNPSTIRASSGAWRLGK